MFYVSIAHHREHEGFHPDGRRADRDEAPGYFKSSGGGGFEVFSGSSIQRYIPETRDVTMIKKRLFAVSLLISGIIAATLETFAQQASCSDRTLVIERLADRYGVSCQSIGIGRNNAIVEIFA